jgi:starvation-inducible DNA-binding protein
VGGTFRDHHLLVDEDADQIFATNEIAERARKIGGEAVNSVGDISRHQRLRDNDNELVRPKDILTESGKPGRRSDQKENVMLLSAPSFTSF